MCKATRNPNVRASLQELARLGSPVDLCAGQPSGPVVADTDRENEKLEIAQVGCIYDSSFFELPDGRAGCRIVLLITNQTSRAIHTPEVELRSTFWEDDFFQWLEPLRIPVRNSRKPDTSYQVYRFPGPSGLELEYDQVLNHILLEDQSVAPERPFQGFLLAVGGRMPAGLRHGQFIDATLTIIGSDHTEYPQSICLWTERLETRPKAMERRSNLFGEPLNSNARDSVRVPSLESGMHADPNHLQQSHGDRGPLGAGKVGPRRSKSA
jgi:hypothetical protein